MTPSLIRGRPRGAAAHISVRVAHAVLGSAAGLVWLVLPGMTTRTDVPVALTGGLPAASAAAPAAMVGASPCAAAGAAAGAAASARGDTSTADLALPLLAASAAAALAGYGYVRRTRRARTRTTPGGAPVSPPEPPVAELDARTRAALVETDDCVRTSREELDFAGDLLGPAAQPFAAALRTAQAELSAAFRMRQRYDDGVPEETTARRHALAGMAGRCLEAGRRLDAVAAGLDRARGLERDPGKALKEAEARFRELTSRTSAAVTTLTELARRYPPSATAPVTRYPEQAEDRLVFATARLNLARQAADLGDLPRAAGHLRAAESAVAQAGVLVGAVERLAADLAAAVRLVPAALTGAEAELAALRAEAEGPFGEPRARLGQADGVLAAVREEVTGGPYDPLDALRRIVRAVAAAGAGREGVLSAAALLCARVTTAATAAFLVTHRGAVGAEARTRLAEAERLLAARPAEPLAADALARRARELAARDVRQYGGPSAAGAGDVNWTDGAVLAGILLGGDPDGGPPASFGGPRTRARRAHRAQ
ncbi:hypothetical protein [Streptomyces sp. NPDC006134]|uniref:hypothetical protein n=1 Tax=Streptomyces sp. NPDC006134 TaxID=3154467 RepID=UPI00340983B1